MTKGKNKNTMCYRLLVKNYVGTLGYIFIQKKKHWWAYTWDCVRYSNLSNQKEITYIENLFKRFCKRYNIMNKLLFCLIFLLSPFNIYSQFKYVGETEIPQGDFFNSKGEKIFCVGIENGLIQFSENDVYEIGNYAFHNCDKLEKLQISESVKKVGFFAFSNLNKLTKPIYNSSIFCRTSHFLTQTTHVQEPIKIISSAAFRNSKIENIVLPKTLEKIDDSAFAYCNNLKSIIIQSNITMGENIFFKTDSLKMIFIKVETPPIISNKTFNLFKKEECFLFIPEGEMYSYQVNQNYSGFEMVEYEELKNGGIKLIFNKNNTISKIETAINLFDINTPIYVDLTNVNSNISFNINVKNKNCLFEISEKTNLSNTDNVILNGVCENLVLTDTYPLLVIKQFTAKNVSYTRNVNSKYSTLILPFKIKNNAVFELFKISICDINNGILFVNKIQENEANIPFLIKTIDKSFTIDLTNISVQTNTDIIYNKKYNDCVFKGTYLKQTIDCENDNIDNVYYFGSQDDYIYHANQIVEIYPFRCWLETSNPNFSSFRIDENNNDDIKINQIIETHDEYDIMGRKNKNNGLIIKNKQIYFIK